jgi:hypothetical protein
MTMTLRSGSRCLALLACLGLLAGLQASMASAHTGEYAKFNYCPSTTAGVAKCVYSKVEGGEVILGSKKVPIVNPVILQGGYSKANKETQFFSKFYAATNGVTLSKAPQPVPGGLLGIVPPESSPWIVKKLSSFFFENGLTGVNSTLELALSASEIKISERNQLFQLGPALVLPVKVHLENPFLGNNCYVGSSGSPIWLNLTTGTTAPPAPNTPISGAVGNGELIEEEGILKYTNVKLVDNAWSAPTASGCGGILSFLVNPIINSMLGLPSAGGHNTAIQTPVSIYSSPAVTVNAH